MPTEINQNKEAQPLLLKVICDDMCIACGACILRCPNNVIEPTYNKKRAVHEVKINKFDFCYGCSRCDKVCPSINVNFSELLNLSKQRPHIQRMGPLNSVQIGYAPEYQFDGISSSGGIIHALLVDAVEQNKPVICLGKLNDGYGAIHVKTIADIEKIPGSIYHSISFTDGIQLLREVDRPCVLVALPCHLEGIRNYILNVERELIKNIDLTIGLICGWMYSHHAIYAFAHYKNIKAAIRDVGYRGEDKVGTLKLYTINTQHSYSRRIFSSIKEWIDYRSSFSRTMNRLRCRVCEDHLNILADIVVGDAWLKNYTNEKTSIVLIRNQNGDSALKELKKKGKVILNEGSIEDIIESQSENLVYGRSAQLMNAYLKTRHIITPELSFGEDQRQRHVLKFHHRIFFAYELFMRRIVQKSRYNFFRFAFVFYKWPLIIMFSIRQLINRCCGSLGLK